MKLDAFRCDVTGIAIPNYAMFLLFFFQCGASRFSWREFSHAPKVPNDAYATIAAFPGSRTKHGRYLQAICAAWRESHKRIDVKTVPIVT